MPATADCLRHFTESVIRDMTRVSNKYDAINLSQGFPDFGTPVELINVRLRAVGITEKPPHIEEPRAEEDPREALKGERSLYIPEDRDFKTVSVFDGHKTRHGHRIAGPALIEQVNTTLFLSSSFDCICDKYGSFAVYRKGRDDLVASTLEGT